MTTQIDMDKLEQLANEAGGERWIRLFGERTVYDRMEDGCRGVPMVSTDHHPPTSDQANKLDFVAAANPAVVLELVRRLRVAEAKESAFQDMTMALVGLLDTMQNAPPVDLIRRLGESHKECLAAYTKAYEAIAAQGASHD